MKRRALRNRVAMALGAALRAAWEARGPSQERFSTQGDFDRTYRRLLERGERTLTLTMILRLAETLGIDPIELAIDTLIRLGGGTEPRRLYVTNDLNSHKYAALVGLTSWEQAVAELSLSNRLGQGFGRPAVTHISTFVESGRREVSPEAIGCDRDRSRRRK